MMSQILLSAALSLVGDWHYFKMVFQGHEMPPRDPRLDLRFDFKSDGQNRLYWSYDQGQTFCERRGMYSVSSNQIDDLVTWVNPQNRSDCGQDPDMQVGNHTLSNFEIRNDQFRLEIPFGNENITYIFERVNAQGSSVD